MSSPKLPPSLIEDLERSFDAAETRFPILKSIPDVKSWTSMGTLIHDSLACDLKDLEERLKTCKKRKHALTGADFLLSDAMVPNATTEWTPQFISPGRGPQPMALPRSGGDHNFHKLKTRLSSQIANTQQILLEDLARAWPPIRNTPKQHTNPCGEIALGSHDPEIQTQIDYSDTEV